MLNKNNGLLYKQQKLRKFSKVKFQIINGTMQTIVGKIKQLI